MGTDSLDRVLHDIRTLHRQHVSVCNVQAAERAGTGADRPTVLTSELHAHVCGWGVCARGMVCVRAGEGCMCARVGKAG